MPLFCGAYLGDTMHLSLEEHGAYLKLLMVTWLNGAPLPDEDARLARVLGVTVPRWRDKLRPVIAEFFDLSGGVWLHHRLQKEWDFVQKYKAEQSKKGSRGGAAKALKDKKVDVAAATPGPCPEASTYPYPQEERTVASATAGKPAPLTPLELDSEFWRTATAYLGEDKRSLIGRWRKDHGREPVMAALVRAQAENPSDRIEFITGCLRTKPNGRRTHAGPNDTLAGFADALGYQRAADREPDHGVAGPILDARDVA